GGDRCHVGSVGQPGESFRTRADGDVNQIDLRGRRAVITGGAEGFGRAVAERFLRSGAAVSLWDITRELVTKTSGELAAVGPVLTAIADVSDQAKVETAVAATLAEWHSIDILIANAGVSGPTATTWEYPIDVWRRVVEVNLFGTFYCCRAV